MIKKVAWGILIFFSAIALFVVTAVAPIDDAPLTSFKEVNKTFDRLNKTKFEIANGKSVLSAGWTTVNITPRSPINMAGYGPRGPYTSVADSLFAKIVILENGGFEAVIISPDLLMFPRILSKKLQDALSKDGISPARVFLSATHTHNGFGNWDKSLVGEFAFGKYDDEHINYVLEKLMSGIAAARQNKVAVEIGFEKFDAHELVTNRLAPETGTKDPFLRVVTLKTNHDKKVLLVSFSGHPVNLDADIWELSRDYPGTLVDRLEHDPHVDFAMFCAGMVASHNIKSDLLKGHERIKKVGERLSQKILTSAVELSYDSMVTISSLDIQIDLPPSQLRLTESLRLRDWIFKAFFGKLQANIKVLNIGDIMMIGMPCDYSGELSINNQLDKLAAEHGKNLFITSFNGNYIGYITEDAHYMGCTHDEVRSLNWVGPHKGRFFTDIIKVLIEKHN